MLWVSFFIVFSSMAVYCVIHSMMASIGFKKWVGAFSAPLYNKYYRLFYSVFSVVSLVPTLYLLRVLPDLELYRISLPWVILTVMVQVAASILLLLSLMQTGIWDFVGLAQLFTENRNTAQFKTTGFYRLVRHPIYSLGFIIIWLTPIMSLNILAFNIAISLYLYFGARVEEKKLLEEFSEYAAYQQQVPMFIPRIHIHLNK